MPSKNQQKSTKTGKNSQPKIKNTIKLNPNHPTGRAILKRNKALDDVLKGMN
jgi:hypothetical protein